MRYRCIQKALLCFFGISFFWFVVFFIFQQTTWFEHATQWITRTQAQFDTATFVSDSDMLLQYGPHELLSNPDFFAQTRDTFIRESVDFIETDLSEMRMRVHKGGEVVVDVPIHTKGRPGSWWQTPSGLYSVQSKEKKHYSTFGHVYMDWNIPFQGNFFIHGWPYHADGTPVPESYSGGCLRLDNENAQAVFEAAEVGMPILIFENHFSTDNFTYIPRAPHLNTRAYLVADLANNQVLTYTSTESTLPIASITKLMTALVAAEYINLDKMVTITTTTATTKPRFNVGDSVLAFHLLYPLLTESSNEAAVALASVVGESRFVSLMNAKAQSIGMINTHFTDPAGVRADNVASLEDLMRLAQYLYYNRPFVLGLTKGKVEGSAYAQHPFADLGNYNLFAFDDSFVGGKVGLSTDAGETFIAVFNENVYSTERPLVYILLGSEDLEGDTETLRNYVHTLYPATQ